MSDVFLGFGSRVRALRERGGEAVHSTKWVFVLVVAVFGTCALICGCGSDGPTSSRKARDGRVLLRNDTPFDIRAIYTHEEYGEIETLVLRRTIDPPADVSQYVLPGGTTVRFKFVEVRSGAGNLLDHFVDVPVDGNVTVLATFAGGSAPVEFVVT